MMNSVGACMLAATVCPTSTLRCVTMPSIGAWITVWSRFTWFWLTDACDWLTAARVCKTVASCDARLACAESTAILAESRSLCGNRLLLASSFERANFCCASVSCTLVRSRSLCALVRFACVCARLALAC